MGKSIYADVAKKLPKLASTEPPKRQEAINTLKATILKNTPKQATALATRYAEVRREKDKLEEELSDTNLLLDAITQLMIEQYDAEDVTFLRLKDGSSIAVQWEPYASVKDPDSFRQWCINEGLERSLQLPWPKTNELTKQRLLDGLPEPTGVQAFLKAKPVRRGAKE